MGKVSSGAAFLDSFLDGGYDDNIITTVYGPSGSGKTNLCLIAAVTMAEKGKKVLFMDTEGGIAIERIKQLTSNFDDVIQRLFFFSPVNFSQQKEIFETMRNMVNDSVGLIVIDSISMLYRLELGRSDEVFEVNSALGRQIAYLVEIARTRNIPVLITNQVYVDFNSKEIRMVGGDLLKYGSKCLLELQKFVNCRGLILRKHRSLPEGIEARFRIVQNGMEEVEG
ncbi:DNA repair and recombination protein RadB [Candidatus Woesearchaeota archaeon CG10_big_fil_rev_8_21_14_0_10_45_16]|nr:MAG: DNA repair and recombination protein RadB [Candidatus Woesearchaeota archaeon CG10_big_fil_rev_8_21_14_0_10_45_16]